MFSYAGQPFPVAWLAGGFTLIKTVLIYATFLAAAADVVLWLWVRLRRWLAVDEIQVLGKALNRIAGRDSADSDAAPKADPHERS